MSIELLLTALTAALTANTAALTASNGTPSAAATVPATSTATSTAGATDAVVKSETAKAVKETKAVKEVKVEAPKSKHTRAEMTAALNEVKEKLGTTEAKAVIKSAGYDKMADVADKDIDTVYAAAKAKIEGEDDGSDNGDGL